MFPGLPGLWSGVCAPARQRETRSGGEGAQAPMLLDMARGEGCTTTGTAVARGTRGTEMALDSFELAGRVRSVIAADALPVITDAEHPAEIIREALCEGLPFEPTINFRPGEGTMDLVFRAYDGHNHNVEVIETARSFADALGVDWIAEARFEGDLFGTPSFRFRMPTPPVIATAIAEDKYAYRGRLVWLDTYELPPFEPPTVDPASGPDTLAVVNAARTAFGFRPLDDLRANHPGLSKRDAFVRALVTALPARAQIDLGTKRFEICMPRIAAETDERNAYTVGREITEKLAAALGVEPQRTPFGAISGRYTANGGTASFILPLPDAVIDWFGDEDYRPAPPVRGWQPPEDYPDYIPHTWFDGSQIFGPKIRRKSDMYKLYEQGALGNKLRTWSSTDELAASGYSGSVTLRYKGKAGVGGWCAYDLAPDKVAETVATWVGEGADPKLIVANESAPDERLLVQGDVGRNPAGGGGLVFRYSTERVKMRVAMETATHAYGAEASALVGGYLSAGSLADVQELLELYPDAIVEFSAYEMTVGERPGRNAVIWEVRDY